MDEALVDKKTGLVKPPIYPCCQDETKLCDLRQLKDSNMECMFDVKSGCSHSREKK